MLRSVLILLLVGVLSGAARAQPVLGWAAADTLVAGGENQFSYVPASPLASGGGARAVNARFEVEYVGFPDDARTAFQAAVDIWSAHLDSDVPIRVRATWEPADEDDVLGATNPRVIANFELNTVAEPDIWYAVALANALAGRDLDPDEPHIRTSFNSAFNHWYFGTDGQPPAGQFDLLTIALHELGHGLGFVGSMVVEGGVGERGLGNQGFPIIYDRFAERGNGQALLDLPSPSETLAEALTSGDLTFDGEAAVRAQGGARPALHAPTTWVSGSSYSHLSERRVGGVEPYPPGSINSLMTPTIAPTEAVHNPGPVTCGMFEDMGWPLAAACARQVPSDPSNPDASDALTVYYDEFTNPTSVRFGVPRLAFTAETSQYVEIFLFDTLGRRVARLFDGTVPAGQPRAIDIDVSGLAAGVYFVWIESPDFFETRPLTVLR